MPDESNKAYERLRVISGLKRTLEGKVLRLTKNMADRDYSGGGYYNEVSEAIFLYDDGTFRYERHSFSSVSGGGLSLPSESKGSETGYWEIQLFQDTPMLVLTVNGSVFASWNTRDGGTGIQYLNGEAWNRYLIK